MILATSPTFLVPLALWGWLPLAVALFAVLPTRRAVLVSFILGWLFLPVYSYPLPGLPDYTKVSAMGFGILLGIILFDRNLLQRFRLNWYDLPMIVWCLCPAFSSISNDLGIYDAISQSLNHVIVWGLPYFIGRAYFSGVLGLHELTIAIFIGGLIYVPFCLYEVKMSPQLHDIFYGFHQHSFGQTKRLGGWRPMVFMQHGLAVGMWMSAAALTGFWLWWSSTTQRLWTLRMAWLVPIMLIMVVLVRSTNALFLLALGIAVLASIRWSRSIIPVFCLLLIAPTYMTLRTAGDWSGESLAEMIEPIVGEERSESLTFRMENEDLIMDRALEQPLFGWGTGSRFRPISEDERKHAVSDGLWVITMGKYGLVGLLSLTLIFLMPLFLLTQRCPAYLWSHPTIAPAAVLGVLLALYMIDCLPNAMLNPIFVLCAGGLIGAQPQLRQAALKISHKQKQQIIRADRARTRVA